MENDFAKLILKDEKTTIEQGKILERLMKKKQDKLFEDGDTDKAFELGICRMIVDNLVAIAEKKVGDNQ